MPRMYNGRRLGIHDPPEPSINALPPDARARWDEAYAASMAAYNRPDVAEATAWRTVRLSYAPADANGRTWARCANNRCVKWPNARRLPMPKSELVGLGVLIEYGLVDPRGQLHVIPMDRDTPPILWWDNVGKRLYAFPGQTYPGCDIIPKDMEEAVRVYRRWTKNRKPNCASQVVVPDVKVHAVGVADTISYRSDKFDGGSELRVVELRGTPIQDPTMPKSQEYIHKHWHDVWTWQDSGDPEAIMIEGGALDLHAKGIIH